MLRCIGYGGVVHVPDARRDMRFAANPWVDGRLGGIRSYAAAPLLTPGGQVLGTLCVFDSDLRNLTAASAPSSPTSRRSWSPCSTGSAGRGGRRPAVER